MKLFPSLLLSLLFELRIIYLILSIHQSAELLHFGSQEISFFLRRLKLKMVLEQTIFSELVLNILDSSDQIEVTGPAWHFLVDLLVLVHDSDLLDEVLLIHLSADLDKISPIVEFFVVHENVGL